MSGGAGAPVGMRPGLGLRHGGAGRGASRCVERFHMSGPLAAPAPCCAHRVAAAPAKDAGRRRDGIGIGVDVTEEAA